MDPMVNTSSTIYCILPQSFSCKSLQTHTCSDLFNTRASSKAFSRGIPEKANGWMDKKSGWMGVLFCLQGNKCIHMMVIGIKSQQYQTLSLFESHVFFHNSFQTLSFPRHLLFGTVTWQKVRWSPNCQAIFWRSRPQVIPNYTFRSQAVPAHLETT